MKKLVAVYKQKRNTMMFRVTFWYISVLFIVVALIGLTLTSVISVQLYQSTKKEAATIFEKLEKEALGDGDWTELLSELAPANQSEVFIRITTPNGAKIQSENARKFLEGQAEWYHSSWVPSIIWKKSGPPFFNEVTQVSNFQFEVFINMQGIIEMIELIMKTLIWVTIISLVIGAYIIYRLSKKINQPLLQVTEEISIIQEQLEKLEMNVTVPSSPKEVSDLALAFNQLLDLLNKKMMKERQFVSDASHELRTPLAAIRGHINLIKRRGESHPEIVASSLNFIDRESLRMQRLIEQLLLAASLDKQPKKSVPINLSTFVQNIASDYQFIFEQKFISEIAEGIFIHGNEDSLQQIIVSLLDNAYKYTPKDGCIKLTVNEQNQQAIIMVQDTGPGIPDTEKKKIFERFYRIDPSRSSQISGTGLGLAITKQLIDLNDGTIEVQDANPIGSVFIVRFHTIEAPDSSNC